MNSFSEWELVQLQSGFDTSDIALQLKLARQGPLPVVDDPLFTLRPDDGAPDQLSKSIMDSQPLVEIFGVEPSAALKITRTRNNAHAEVADLIKAKVANMITQAPLRKHAVAGILKQFKQALAARGYSTPNADGWDRLAVSMEKFVASQVAAAT